MPDRELIERLRKLAADERENAMSDLTIDVDLFHKAADRIEALERALDLIEGDRDLLREKWDRDAAVLEGLKKALVEAAIPLEVLYGEQQRLPYEELSPKLERQIADSVLSIRAALQHAQSSVEGGDDG